MILTHIVAASQNHVIGSDNGLPWHIPEDLQFFKDKTKGHIVVMGRKTFESIGKPLPNRLNIVISRREDFAPAGAIKVSSLDEALAECEKHVEPWGEEIFICGGGEIYRASMERADKIYLTRIHQDFDGDTTYPEVDLEIFRETDRDARAGEVPFTFVTYQRRV